MFRPQRRLLRYYSKLANNGTTTPPTAGATIESTASRVKPRIKTFSVYRWVSLG
jgi:hypothetical protein